MFTDLQLTGFLLALTLALILAPLVARTALRLGLVDQPGERKIHQTPVPRFGGVAIWMAYMIAILILMLLSGGYPHGASMFGILTGATLMFCVGVLDDRFNLSPYVKFAGQIAAACAAFYLGVQIQTIDLPGNVVLLLHAFSLPVTVLWLVGIANAMNFIDGVDGLAGGVATISAVTMAVAAGFTHQPIAAVMAALLAGATLGFLVYNFFPARIFMGDSGSLFCGFVLASIAVTGVMKTPVVVVVAPVAILAVPILDVAYSTLRRVFKGRNPFIADAGHIHHKLLDAGLTQVRIVGLLYAVCAVTGMAATYYLHLLGSYLLLLGGLLALTLGLLMLRFSSNVEEFRKLETAERRRAARIVTPDARSPQALTPSS
ncbi:MAG: undecaprenyl/decaprenyl-phosphate alpha-N-acetylglucosaminyl 1-phosphate transferase [Vampirovibrionales bacterium]|nr:undecaprenyl/decaprenyl-phosphate alpha-N-acetylglucosaminyl 1-phosphate transferase [Vampirovibrionales bacterium]